MKLAPKNAMHSAESVDHYTPGPIVEAARFTLDVIDLDPASCELANRSVRARVYFTKDDNGLAQSWGRPLAASLADTYRVFCNPPGGKDGGESIQKLWWRHAAKQWQAGIVDALVWVAFKVDFLQVTQTDVTHGDVIPLDGAVCYPRERLAYLSPTLPGPTEANPERKPTKRQVTDHRLTGLCTGDSPPHASAIVYLPSRRDPEGLARFVESFGKLGEVRYDPRYIDVIMRGGAIAGRGKAPQLGLFEGVS